MTSRLNCDQCQREACVCTDDDNLVECPMCEGDGKIYFCERDLIDLCPECDGSCKVPLEQAERFK